MKGIILPEFLSHDALRLPKAAKKENQNQEAKPASDMDNRHNQ